MATPERLIQPADAGVCDATPIPGYIRSGRNEKELQGTAFDRRTELPFPADLINLVRPCVSFRSVNGKNNSK